MTFDDQVTDMLDLSGRVGYVTGPVHLYAMAGLSRSALELVAVSGPTDTAFTGFHMGLGADYRVNDSLSIGVNYIARQFQDIDYNPAFNPPIDQINSQSLSLRAAFRF